MEKQYFILKPDLYEDNIFCPFTEIEALEELKSHKTKFYFQSEKILITKIVDIDFLLSENQ